MEVTSFSTISQPERDDYYSTIKLKMKKFELIGFEYRIFDKPCLVHLGKYIVMGRNCHLIYLHLVDASAIYYIVFGTNVLASTYYYIMLNVYIYI